MSKDFNILRHYPGQLSFLNPVFSGVTSVDSAQEGVASFFSVVNTSSNLKELINNYDPSNPSSQSGPITAIE